MHQQQTAFENIVGKEEIARFPQRGKEEIACFILNQKILSPFINIYHIISLSSAELEEPKIGMWGKGLILYQTTKNLDSSKIKSFGDNKINVT